MADQSMRRKINRNTALAVPLVLFGLIGYVTYVVVDGLCVDYLLKPALELELTRRPRTATVILVLYFVLLLLWLTPYVRIIQVIHSNPGYIPKAKRPAFGGNQVGGDAQSFSRSCAPQQVGENLQEETRPNGSVGYDGLKSHEDIDRNAILNGQEAPPPGLDYFYTKDAFVCDYRGLPIFCTQCWNWKFDRTHHCSEVGRCVRRMDHFCPWVGGIVSETNMKFFLQLLFYGAFLNAYILIVFAYFLKERQDKTDTVDTHWAVACGLAGIFFFFASGMFGSTIQMLRHNLTTVENLTKSSKIHYVAVFLHNQRLTTSGETPHVFNYQTITYPLVSETTSHSKGPSPNLRTFAILETDPGANLWDLGPTANLQSIFGYTIWDWLLPYRYSPCCSHDPARSEFQFGPKFEELKKAYGILPPGKNRCRHSRNRSTQVEHSNTSNNKTTDSYEMGVLADEMRRKSTDDRTKKKERRDLRRRSYSDQV
ncbi:zf-DHHC-domain-containing protein [Patellaria atrata CBS 101060]|uniref:Palmitoyltransferase n=1 Tax=Patellaria atrata CBS 101060 TaxID=1346257 RepID=A0A9P4SIA9_9PEZI|nr:zf-DHHC-domain-containing protein [Patellaria atrata CBS 101060]